MQLNMELLFDTTLDKIRSLGDIVSDETQNSLDSTVIVINAMKELWASSPEYRRDLMREKFVQTLLTVKEHLRRIERRIERRINNSANNSQEGVDTMELSTEQLFDKVLNKMNYLDGIIPEGERRFLKLTRESTDRLQEKLGECSNELTKETCQKINEHLLSIEKTLELVEKRAKDQSDKPQEE